MPADERSTAGNVSHAFRRCRCHQYREDIQCQTARVVGVSSDQIRVAAATHCVEELCFIVKNLNNLRASHGLSITYELGQRVL